MAGTITSVNRTTGSIRECIFTWLSDASGDATATASTEYYDGEVLKVVIWPSAVGGLVPTGNYTVTLADGDGLDILCGQGTLTCPAAATLVLTSGLLPIVNSTISLTIAASGDVTSGIVYVYVR